MSLTTVIHDEDFVEVAIEGTPFLYNGQIQPRIDEINHRVKQMRARGALSGDSLRHIRKYFRIKNIYHSNAIEGNLLDAGETRQVVELGLTITGKSLKDQAEAKNLGHALDFLETIAGNKENPITQNDIRQIHRLILEGIDNENAGAYRTIEVVISGSDYNPPSHFKVHSEMNDLMDWLEPLSTRLDDYAIQVAAAAHAHFAQIHPFIDGNGRTARILMNLVLMRAGFPIAIVTREDRSRYIDALEHSQISDLTPFIALLIECISETLEEYETAVQEQLERQEWTQLLVDRMSTGDLTRVKNEYELWKSAMDLLLNHYQSIVDDLDGKAPLMRIYIKTFGTLAFDKYLALRQRQSAKRTWFFRVDFVQERKSVRYLHFFGFANRPVSEYAQVSLHLAREETPYYFEFLDNIQRSNVPALREIAYSPQKEIFVARLGSRCEERKIEEIVRSFFEDVVSKHFRN